MFELQHASELCSHCKPGKRMKAGSFLSRALAEHVAVAIFEMFTYILVSLLGFPLSSPAIWALNVHDKVHYIRSHGPWFCSGLARNLTPLKLCVPYDPLRVVIQMTFFPLKVALLDEDVFAGTDFPPALTCSIVRTSRTNQI